MTEPRTEKSRDRRRDARRLLYHQLEEASPHVQELERRCNLMRARFESNQAALRENPLAITESYDVEEVMPDVRRYALHLSRGGELYTTDFEENPQLPRRPDVPSALRITAGDLHAAAQWGILPKLEFSKKRATPHEQAARLLTDLVECQTVLRRLYVEKALYDEQIWDKIGLSGDRAEQPPAFAEFGDAASLTLPVTAEHIRAHLERPPILAEHMCLSLLARLGGRTNPTLTTFQPRAGVDRFKKVDILARVNDTKQGPWLVGVDVTLAFRPKEIWDKFLQTRDQKQTSTPIYTKDPGTGNRLQLYRDVVIWPVQISPEELFQRWQRQRGATTITPEYFIPPRYRAVLGASLLKRICEPNGRRVYSDDVSANVYDTTYGDYDRRSTVATRTTT